MRQYDLFSGLGSLETLELKLSPTSLAVGVVARCGGVDANAPAHG